MVKYTEEEKARMAERTLDEMGDKLSKSGYRNFDTVTDSFQEWSKTIFRFLTFVVIALIASALVYWVWPSGLWGTPLGQLTFADLTRALLSIVLAVIAIGAIMMIGSN